MGCTIAEAKVEVEELSYGAKPMYVYGSPPYLSI